MSVTLGVASLGQAPRPDAVNPMRKVWGGDVRIRERGALDGLSEEEISRLRPRGGEEALITQRADGRTVILSHAAITPRMGEAVSDLAAGGCDPIVVLCTGVFALPDVSVTVLQPRFILTGLVRALASGARLAVLVPEQTQEETLGKLWKNEGFAVITAAASPYGYSDDPRTLDRAASRFHAAEVDLVVLDCMGYTEEMRRYVRRRVEAPVMAARSSVAHAVACIL